jgi:hypothetical protein
MSKGVIMINYILHKLCLYGCDVDGTVKAIVTDVFKNPTPDTIHQY